MTRAVLALGSNLGDRRATMLEAVRRIADTAGVELVAASSLLESAAVKPEGVDPSAPAYLNGVVVVDTALTPEALLEAVNLIEADLGRVRGERWADRTLDIDIIDVVGESRSTERLTLPHPRAAERSFVLAPWLEVDPDAELGGVRVSQLLAKLDSQ
jgi:2-amino-4-hydroxy-6-hydroxymethyldihydropteridine diphosphokinase